MPLRVALDVVRGGQPAKDVIVGAARARDLGDLHLALIGPREAIVEALGTDVEHVAVWDSEPDGGRGVTPRKPADRPESAPAAREASSPGLRLAIDALRAGDVDVVVSAAGPAAVAAAATALPLDPDMDRPLMATHLTTPSGRVLVLDAGTTPRVGPHELVRAASLALAAGLAPPDLRVGILAPFEDPEPAASETAARAQAQLGVEVRPVNVPKVLAGAVDLVLTPGDRGRVLVDAVVVATGDPAAAVGYLLGPDRPVVSLHTAGENEVTAALTELLRRHG